jgi:hypothetical protein
MVYCSESKTIDVHSCGAKMSFPKFSGMLLWEACVKFISCRKDFSLIFSVPYRKLFFIGGGDGAESEGRRPEEIFKFRVSEMPFPGLWGRFDRILLVRKQRFSMPKFTI